VKAIRWTFASPRAWAVAAGLLLAYTVAYLLIAKALVIDPSGQFSRFGPLPILLLSPLSARTLTSWIDPAFVLYLSEAVVLAPSVPAILTVLVLGALVGLNGAMGVETIVRRPPRCESGAGPWWIAGALPSFLATFSCCAPTVLLLLGAGAAGAVISVIPFVVPAAALLLLGSLTWSARRLERTTIVEAGRRAASGALGRT
jgi:hypothetical protein